VGREEVGTAIYLRRKAHPHELREEGEGRRNVREVFIILVNGLRRVRRVFSRSALACCRAKRPDDHRLGRLGN